MAASLSAYWVKFFKGAGFPQDVATKHAVVFSNNRIKPDMLPDLDKPSLKEMGITLMGDMIAILRYAKKVVEETTCERFLVDSEDSVQSKTVTKPIIKKVISKIPSKTLLSTKVKCGSPNNVKPVKTLSSSTVKTVTVKKPLNTKSVVTDHEDQKRKVSVKRKVERQEDFDDDNEDDWDISTKKKVKPSMDNGEDKVGYTVMLPKGSTVRSPQILKKTIDQKRTVFDRLGDSSVTSTTNLTEASPTFNVTGLGKDIFKRSASVFNRLGDKDAKKDDVAQSGILKNGNTSQGILKNWSPSMGTSNLTSKKVVTKSVGTMHADVEANKKASSSIKQLLKTTKKITFDSKSPNSTKVIKPDMMSGKLASERLTSLPAKARLGVSGASGNTKQVTFNRIATVTHVRKPDVFSRLGI